MKIYGITGYKNAGKTGLMERLVTEITGRGFTVSTVKHAHHSFDVDHPGNRAIGGPDRHALTDQLLRVPAANRLSVEKTEIIDMANEQADLIAVASEHHAKR